MSTIAFYEPSDTYTLDSEISAGKLVELSHGNMQFKKKFEGMIIPYQTLISKYHNVLAPYITEYTFTDEEFDKYYQKPKLLSMDLYGTPELWSGLLYINNMISIMNFTKKSVKIFTNGIIGALEEIMTIYNEDLTANKKEVYGD